MTKAVLFHGSGGTPDLFWFPWLRKELEARGLQVWAPQLPHPEAPSLDPWLEKALEFDGYDSETVLIGHSSGCALILALLEVLPAPVKQAVFVGGYAQQLAGSPSRVLKAEYDWDRIRANAGEFVFINSDDDPWGCDDSAGRYMLDRLGGTLVIPSGQGHMGSVSFDQPYEQFPLLLRLINVSDASADA